MKPQHSALKLLLFLSITIGCTFFFMFMMGIMVASATGGDFSQMPGYMANMINKPNQAIMMQGVMHLCVFLMAPLLFITFIEKQNINSYLGFRVQIKWEFIFYTLVLLFSVQAVIWLSIEGFKVLPLGEKIHHYLQSNQDEMELLTKNLLSSKDMISFIINLIVIGGLAALCEEIFFRGVIQKFVHKTSKNIHFAVFISSFCFAIMHGLSYNTMGILFIGMLLGYIYYYTGNLLVTMLFHFLNNSMQVVMSYLFNIGSMQTDVSQIDSFTWIQCAVSIAITGFAFYRIYRNRHPDFEIFKPINLENQY
jgi:uncharacterized protein